MFAPVFHPAMKHAAAPRRDIGIRTVFNILGPLTNPARAGHILLGVPSPEIGEKIAAVLYRLGTKHSLVVHGNDGLDEISISDSSFVWDVSQDGTKEPYQVEPVTFGINKSAKSEIIGGSTEENAAIINRLFEGERGPRRDMVVVNAAAALVAGDVTDNMEHAAHIAQQAIDSGKAKDKLNMLVDTSRRIG
jgi:anthranilate phosphoribosyltransferase